MWGGMCVCVGGYVGGGTCFITEIIKCSVNKQGVW